MVRVNVNNNKFAKGHEPSWSRERYKVVCIKGNQSLIPSINKDKLYLRNELLKVQSYFFSNVSIMFDSFCCSYSCYFYSCYFYYCFLLLLLFLFWLLLFLLFLFLLFLFLLFLLLLFLFLLFLFFFFLLVVCISFFIFIFMSEPRAGPRARPPSRSPFGTAAN